MCPYLNKITNLLSSENLYQEEKNADKNKIDKKRQELEDYRRRMNKLRRR